MQSIRKFVKTHKYEIVLVSVGAIVGASYTRRKYDGREDDLIDEINRQMEAAFKQYRGNFQNPDGNYIVPVWNKW